MASRSRQMLEMSLGSGTLSTSTSASSEVIHAGTLSTSTSASSEVIHAGTLSTSTSASSKVIHALSTSTSASSEVILAGTLSSLESQRGPLLLPSLTGKKESSFAAIPEQQSWASGDDGQHHLPRLFVPIQSNKRLKTFVNTTKQYSHSLESHRSTTSTPATYRRHSPTVEDLILDSENRMAMNNATCSIARLAAKRRGGGGGGRAIATRARHSDTDQNLSSEKTPKKRARWTPTETDVVRAYFRDFLNRENGLPQKKAILRFKALHPEIEYQWETIRTKVFNEQLAFRKKKKRCLELLH